MNQFNLNINYITFYIFMLFGITSCHKAEINPAETHNTAFQINAGPDNQRGLGEGESEDPYVQLNGDITDANGQTVANQFVELLWSSDSTRVASAISSLLGEFEMQVNPGNYLFKLDLANGNQIYTDPFQLIDSSRVVIVLP